MPNVKPISIPVWQLHYVWERDPTGAVNMAKILRSQVHIAALGLLGDGATSVPDHVRGLYRDIRDNGMTNPLVVQKEGECWFVYTGCQRLVVLRSLGIEEAPCLVADEQNSVTDLTNSCVPFRWNAERARYLPCPD